MRRGQIVAIVAAAALLGSGAGAAGQAGPAGDLRSRLEAIVRTAGTAGAEVAVAAATVDGRDTVAIDGATVFHAASTMKVPVMVELFDRTAAGHLALDDRIPVVNRFTSVVDGSPFTLSVGDDSDDEIYGAIGSERSYRQLCEAMITVSSNLATNLLIDRLGAERVAATMSRYGAAGMAVRRGVEDNKAFERGLNNTATADAFAAILLAIARRSAVSAAASDEMLAILQRQRFRGGIPAGVPPGIPVGNKTGTITRVHHDGAIVSAARPYVLVVLTRGFADEASSDAVIARISSVVYEAWNGGVMR